jgi:Protein of unknown function (DUF1570)
MMLSLAVLVASGLPSVQGSEGLDELCRRFAFTSKSEHVVVRSDISQEFCAVHADHAERVWTFFARMFSKTPGPMAELYYTRDEELYSRIAKIVGEEVIPGGRRVTSQWSGDHRKWFIIPYQDPDLGTQLHEMGHDFLYATYPGSEECPWLKEGLGMYFESGRLDEKAKFSVTRPFPSMHAAFRERSKSDALVPLSKLLTLSRADFYKSDPQTVYSQSMMFCFFLMRRHEKTMDRLFERLNRARIDSNRQVIDFILEDSKTDLKSLDAEYRAFALAWPE